MNLCAVVVTYYPDIEDAKQKIMRYLPWIDHLIIWENTPQIDSSNYKVIIPEYANKISYMGTGKNEGISYALNCAIEYASKKGFTHLLTMDQDSYWENFYTYLDCVTQNINKSVIFSPNINWEYPQKLFFTDYSITSGSIYNLNIFSTIGLFNEDFFIDAVDTEFCYRAKKNGYSVLLLGNHNLKQKFGNLSKTNNFYIIQYSSFRRFYIVRNHIWLWRMYGNSLSPKLKKWILYQITKEPIKIIIGETGKLRKIFAIVKGVFYGLLTCPKNKIYKYNTHEF